MNSPNCIDHLLHEDFGALVLDVSLGCGEKGADSVDRDAGFYEGRARLLQLVQAVVIGGIHDSFGGYKMVILTPVCLIDICRKLSVFAFVSFKRIASRKK